MQGAILFDRPALSIRNLAISALIVLAREPETLLGPSLQMSYAAVAGLIAMAEWISRRPRRREPGGLGYRIVLWASAAAAGTVTTTLVATLATGPFSAFHFQNLNPYGLIGNALTLPLVPRWSCRQPCSAFWPTPSASTARCGSSWASA